MTRRTHNHVTDLVAQYYGVDKGELCIDGVPVSTIVEQVGSPLFIYSQGALDRKWDTIKRVLPTEFSVYYSIKANPNQTILRYFVDRGCGLEVASAGELHQALASGCDADNVIYAGPGKTDGELLAAVRYGVGEIHVESIGEATRLSRFATECDRTVSIALRVNASAEALGGAMRMGGKPTPFGIDEERLDEATDAVSQLAGLELSGVHLFSGTQILDYQVLLAQYRKAIEIAESVARRNGRPLRTIDFGGGWGIPYFPQEQALDLESLSRELGQLVHEIQQRPLLKSARLLLEPGRFLVGEAGLYVARVSEVKHSRGKTFVITDGGLHHHLAASGNLGQTIKRNYPIALVNRLADDRDTTVDVVGPLCTPLDVLGRALQLPLPSAGDLVGVFQSGAYARSASPLGFLSHPSPPEVWTANSQHQLIRRRGSNDDFLVGQSPPLPDLSLPTTSYPSCPV